MTMIRCNADKHFYDNTKNTECPHCRRLSQGRDAPNTGGGTTGDLGTNSPPYHSEETEGRGPRNPPPPAPDGRTIGLWERTFGFEPVVGWLVCFEGPHNIGKDYHIKPGINQIGRDALTGVKIVISGDMLISRVDHAEIEYDDKENAYYLIRKSNQEVFLNGNRVRQPALLNSHDVIQLGESKFLFIALCGDKFKWETEE